jgi:hypothetical protein
MDTRHCIFIISFIRYIHNMGQPKVARPAFGVKSGGPHQAINYRGLDFSIEISIHRIGPEHTLISDNGVDLYGIWNVTSPDLGQILGPTCKGET